MLDELGSCCRQRDRTQAERMEFGPAAGELGNGGVIIMKLLRLGE